MEVKNFKFANTKELEDQWEIIFNILANTEDPETLLMMVLINKSLEEVCKRRIEADDFFHQDQLFEALKLIEHWLDSKSYFLSKVH